MSEPLRIQYEGDRTSLRRALGTPTLVVFGLAYIVPMTVFTTYGVVNSITQGHLTMAYVVTLVAMLFTAVSYALLSRDITSAGSAYAYSRAGFGGHVGFVTGWAIMMDYILLPMLNYLLIGIYLNAQFSSVPTWVFILAALVLVTGLNVVGINAVKGANAVLVGLQIAFFVVFFVFAARSFDPSVSLLDPFIGGNFDLSLIVAGSAVLSLSFLGFDAVSTMAEEAKDPRRTVPRAIVLTALVGGLLFIAISWAAYMAFPKFFSGAEAEQAAVNMLAHIGGNILVSLFLAAYVTGAMGSALASQASVTRILYTMGRDRVLPQAVFGRLSKKFYTPTGAIFVVAMISLSALFASVEFVASIVSFGALTAFSLVNLSVVSVYLVQRRRRGAAAGMVYGVVPVIGFALTLWLWTNLSEVALLVGVAWVALGVFYLGILTRGFRQQPPSFGDQ